MKKIIFILIIVIFLGASSAWAETLCQSENNNNDPILVMLKSEDNGESIPFRRSDLRAAEKSIKEMLFFLGSTKYKINHSYSNVLIDKSNKQDYVLPIIEKEKELRKYIEKICQEDQKFNQWWKNKQLEKSLESNVNFREFYHTNNDPSSYSNIKEDQGNKKQTTLIADKIIIYYPNQIITVSLQNGMTLYTNLVCSTLEN